MLLVFYTIVKGFPTFLLEIGFRFKLAQFYIFYSTTDIYKIEPILPKPNLKKKGSGP